MRTFGEVLDLAGVTVPPELEAAATVPVLSGVQRQGDVLVKPGRKSEGEYVPVPPEGVAVVRGEATGNTHLLMADGPVFWRAAAQSAGMLELGQVVVPDGSVGWLIHTDEHGCNGLAAGVYDLMGKREQADEIRRVAD